MCVKSTRSQLKWEARQRIHKPEQRPVQHNYSALSLRLVSGVQAAEQGLDVAKLMGGAQPLKEEEDMWFRQQNRSLPLLVYLMMLPACCAFALCRVLLGCSKNRG